MNKPSSVTESEQRINELKKIIGDYPTAPGVYLMKNAIDKIIYVGKAKALRSRVRSYFNGKTHSAKTKSLVSHIAKIEYILTSTEVEAFLLGAEHHGLEAVLGIARVVV